MITSQPSHDAVLSSTGSGMNYVLYRQHKFENVRQFQEHLTYVADRYRQRAEQFNRALAV